MKNLLVLTLLMFTFFASKAQIKVDSVALNKKRNVPVTQFGVASFYADKFEGQRTCTDVVFTQKKLTAACNTFPLNVWIKVTNLRNHKSVNVKINDRMHPSNPRLIDMSKSAALALGYTGHGLTKVKIEYLGKNKPDEDDIADNN
ncbi:MULTISPECIES: septal ring lytic transglycosylase RlpA family protein [Niastella]|uniref:Septal ring lytic transglycosylase RlpA family protein n=1 Tax=Niastella soli TaxID=2821487 RepID=A0ABS3YTC8_9BACT|nr:septal ring lytic transglycosylase RlpA family protein [Niastella soli]MBO9201166.1 septal ring lytic transglycosylase RlpA family protein [Niastella soli]